MSTTPASVRLFVLGNPLLDISATVDDAFLAKHQLKRSNAILAEEAHLPIYAELASFEKVDFIAGGSGLNTARTAQWLSAERFTVTYQGCVGVDRYAELLKTCAMEKDGVFLNLLEDASQATGTCAVCIVDKDRSMVANLAAANHYKIDHLLQPLSLASIEQAQIFYMAAFHLTVSPESAIHLGKHAAQHNKVFALNLSAPFLVEVPFFRERVLAQLPYADYIFANEHEAAAIGNVMSWGSDLKVVAKHLAEFAKENSARPRTVIITQGKDASLVVVGSADAREFPVIPIEESSIVDVNGAGDSFVGGFLARLLLGGSLEHCMAEAAYGAWVIIQQSGCSFPSTKPAATHAGFSFP